MEIMVRNSSTYQLVEDDCTSYLSSLLYKSNQPEPSPATSPVPLSPSSLAACYRAQAWPGWEPGRFDLCALFRNGLGPECTIRMGDVESLIYLRVHDTVDGLHICSTFDRCVHKVTLPCSYHSPVNNNKRKRRAIAQGSILHYASVHFIPNTTKPNQS